jgi:hypothetical protein
MVLLSEYTQVKDPLYFEQFSGCSQPQHKNIEYKEQKKEGLPAFASPILCGRPPACIRFSLFGGFSRTRGQL